MRILLTGGSGFIGSHFAQYLLADTKHNIISVDLGVSDNMKLLENEYGNRLDNLIASFLDLERMEFILNKEIDAIVHFARTIPPGPGLNNFEKDIKENILGSVKFYNLAHQFDVKHFVHISSGGSVYGNLNSEIIDELSPTFPVNYYGLSCLTTENYLKLSNLPETKITVLRISNPYGNKTIFKRNQGIIDIMIKKIKNNELIEIWGDGSSVRDYIHISDVCSALNSCINSYNNLDNFDVINVSSGKGHSLVDLINLLKKVSNQDIKIKYDKSKELTIKSNILDNTKAKKLIGWMPKIDIETGITELFNN